MVALIITIIILIILAAVTIMTIYDNNFVGVAINATEKYAEEQYREIDMLNSLNSKLDDAVDKIKNTRPVIKSCTGIVSDITTITIKVTAIDEDTEELTYTLNWGTDAELKEPNTKTVKGKAGEEVTFEPLTGLGNYELYYWRVDVSDEKGTTKGNIQKTRTWCKTIECTEPFSEEITCTKCKGSGSLSIPCDGVAVVPSGYETKFTSSVICGNCGRRDVKQISETSIILNCSKCGKNGRGSVFGNLQYHLDDPSWKDWNGLCRTCFDSRVITHFKCATVSEVSCPKTETVSLTCSHGCSEKHFYCEHLGNTSESSHGEI